MTQSAAGERVLIVEDEPSTRLGRGEFGVTRDPPPGDEFGELGSFFNAVSQQLSADRRLLAGQKANLQSAVEHLEDGVALFNGPAGCSSATRPCRASFHRMPSAARSRSCSRPATSIGGLSRRRSRRDARTGRSRRGTTSC